MLMRELRNQFIKEQLISAAVIAVTVSTTYFTLDYFVSKRVNPSEKTPIVQIQKDEPEKFYIKKPKSDNPHHYIPDYK